MNIKKYLVAVALFFLTISAVSAEMVSRQAVTDNGGIKLALERINLLVDDSLITPEIVYGQASGTVKKFPLPVSPGTPTVRLETVMALAGSGFMLLGWLMMIHKCRTIEGIVINLFALGSISLSLFLAAYVGFTNNSEFVTSMAFAAMIAAALTTFDIGKSQKRLNVFQVVYLACMTLIVTH